METLFEHVKIVCSEGSLSEFFGRVGVVLSYPTRENEAKHYVVYIDPPGRAVLLEPSSLEFLGTVADSSQIYPGDTIKVRVREEGGELVGEVVEGGGMKKEK